MYSVFYSFIILALVSQGLCATSCSGRCGEDDHTDGCQCNSLCTSYGDCCENFEAICLTCQDRCGESYVYSKPCQCNSDCPSHGNCCTDFNELCGGGTGGNLTDDALRSLTEELFSLDDNNVASLIVYDIQGTTTSDETTDQAPDNLFSTVPPEVLEKDTFKKMLALRDNYEPDVSVSETDTAEELAEIDAFIDAVLATRVMQKAEQYLTENNLVTGDFKEVLTTIWFGLYARAADSSCGAEHVMIGELKNGVVSGFHNWISFHEEEIEGTLDYKGYMSFVDLGDKGMILKDRFTWLGYPKEIGSMFIGTSPELELATFTVCFFARPDGDCPVQMNNQQFLVKTYTMDYGGKTLVGTAYPNI